MRSRATAGRIAAASQVIHAMERRRNRRPRHALRAWSEIARILCAGGPRALFLDFDGTLVGMRRRPEEVRCSPRLLGVLRRLVRRPGLWIGIVSGRRSRVLARMIGVEGMHYRGVYGAESEHAPLKISMAARRALSRVRCAVASQIRTLPRVWMEYKGLSFVIHYRGARQPAVTAAREILCRALAPCSRLLRVIAGRNSWEIVPREISGKGAAVSEVMLTLPESSLGIYIGDDAADESAFAALWGGITIRVGRHGGTLARYFLRNPGEVLEWLSRFEGALP